MSLLQSFDLDYVQTYYCQGSVFATLASALAMVTKVTNTVWDGTRLRSCRTIKANAKGFQVKGIYDVHDAEESQEANVKKAEINVYDMFKYPDYPYEDWGFKFDVDCQQPIEENIENIEQESRPLGDPNTLTLDQLVQRFIGSTDFYLGSAYTKINFKFESSTYRLPAGIPIITPYLFVPFDVCQEQPTFRLQIVYDALDINRYTDLERLITKTNTIVGGYLDVTNNNNHRRAQYNDINIQMHSQLTLSAGSWIKCVLCPHHLTIDSYPILKTFKYVTWTILAFSVLKTKFGTS
jgi:hypothetical protein